MKIFTNWIKNSEKLSNLKVTLVLSIVLFLILEGISSIAYYQKNRSLVQSISSSVASVQWLLPRIKSASDSSKFSRVIDLRKSDIKAYPSYIFKPLLHEPDDYYYLANLPNSYIVYCKESEYFVDFVSDELGFRNPKGQIGSDVDFLFIGDSFVEGACVKEKNTFGGIFRSNEKKVFNLGRGGSGPLFNLATLIEYGSSVKAKTVVWFVFTGNDLQDLREEKTSMLSRYLFNNYNQGLLLQKNLVSKNLENFLEKEINFQKQRVLQNKFLEPEVEQGVQMDNLEAESKEIPLLLRVASMIRKKVIENDSNLAIVVINHPRYRNTKIQDMTSDAIKKFSIKNDVPFIEFSRDYLAKNWKKFYGDQGPHFNSIGYLSVGSEIFNWIQSDNIKSTIISGDK